MSIEITISFATGSVPVAVGITSIATPSGTVPAGITLPIYLTGPSTDSSNTFTTSPLSLPPGVYSYAYSMTLASGVTTSAAAVLEVPGGLCNSVQPLVQVIAANAAGPKQVTVDGQTTMQHSLPDQIALDRYNRSNAAAQRGGFPFKRVKLVSPGPAGDERGPFPHFFDDPNWR